MTERVLQTRFAAASRSESGPDAGFISETRYRQARITEKAQSHFQERRTQLIAKRFGELLIKDAAVPALKPAWAVENRKEQLMRAATHVVEQDQMRRLRRIERAGDRLVRDSKNVELSR